MNRIFRASIMLMAVLFACQGEPPGLESFDLGPIRKLDLAALKKFVEREHKFDKEPNIYLFLIDTLRNDKVNGKDTPNVFDLKKQSLSFTNHYSASTVTHSAMYGIFYSNPVIHRDQILIQEWKQGSPFLQALKRGGYKIHLNGSPWQFCIDTDRVFNTKKELMEAAESNLQLLYGLKTKDLVEFCYPNPGGVSIHQKEPRVPFTGIDEQGKKIGHQGYRDHEVVSDLLKMIDKRPAGETGNFHLVYFTGVHDPYAWLEHGHPIDGSDQYEPIEKYYKIDKPYFPWSADWNAYRPKVPTDQFRLEIKNAYMNAVRGADYQISRVMKKLKDKNEYDNSVIILVSDHGEFLHETTLFPSDNNDRLGHCCAAYDETSNVPMMIKFPNGEFASERKIGSHLDLMPTLLDYLGYSNQDTIPEIAVGKSLFASSRSCATSFDPRGKFAPESFFVANTEDENKLHVALTWKDAFETRGLRSRFLVNKNGSVLADYRENIDSRENAHNLLRRGANAQCVEELTTIPFNDPNYCPTISQVKIPDLKKSFEFYSKMDSLRSGFEEVAADPNIARNEKSGAKVLEDFDEVPLIESQLSDLIGGNYTYDSDFMEKELQKAPNYETLVRTQYMKKFKELKRVDGYTFMGTGTPPEEFERTNGVCNLKGNFDLIQYYHEGDPSQFISSSRTPLMAKRFASVNFSDKSPRNGWVYVVLALGAIQDPSSTEKLKHKDIKSIPTTEKKKNISENYDLPILMSLYAEQEMAIPKGINWSNVVAYRSVKDDGFFRGPIYIRSALKDIDRAAYDAILNKLSGE